MVEILERPHLKNVGYLPHKWKEEFFDPKKEKKVMPIKYSRYNKLWLLTIDASGFRESIRPYPRRVGPDGRLGESN
jgi:hypothetical protein